MGADPTLGPRYGANKVCAIFLPDRPPRHVVAPRAENPIAAEIASLRTERAEPARTGSQTYKDHKDTWMVQQLNGGTEIW